ncbi:MAG: IS481 family transposase [Acidimicrobiia bacterium]
MSERLDFVRLAEGASVPFSELCGRFGVSRTTGYEWWRRWRAEGEAGLVDRSRRPHSSPSQTPVELEEAVVALRNEHPVWGGRKINRLLVNEGHDRVPAPSTVTGILRRRGLLNGERQPRAYQRWERPRPNDLWQMDFKGWFALANAALCHPFGLLDDHSRYNLGLEACSDQRTGTVQALLEKAFRVHGIPDEMLCDNGSPWGNDRGQPWTPLTVWLLDVGIGVIHSRPFHPQTAGKEERFHLTLDLEVISTRPSWPDHHSVQDAFDTWRSIYNHKRPHDALGLDVPADRYRPSTRPYPETIEPVDYPYDYQPRKVSASAHISYQNRRIRVGRAFIGRHVGIRPTTTDGIITIQYRHHIIRTIDLTRPPITP